MHAEGDYKLGGWIKTNDRGLLKHQNKKTVKCVYDLTMKCYVVTFNIVSLIFIYNRVNNNYNIE